jgi:hypothetical protein
MVNDGSEFARPSCAGLCAEANRPHLENLCMSIDPSMEKPHS